MSRHKLAEIYENKVLVEMDVGSVVGGLPTSGGNLENADDYATGDNRIPYLIGRIQFRNGATGKKVKNNMGCHIPRQLHERRHPLLDEKSRLHSNQLRR
jgi:hypothetical protein